MATKFLEPGGDADFGIALWGSSNGSPAVASDFVNSGHQRSVKYRVGQADNLRAPTGAISDAGARISFYMYVNASSTGTPVFFTATISSGASVCFALAITPTGALQLQNGSFAQIGSNSAISLSTGKWYRISIAYTITSSTVNNFRVFLNGVQTISVTNATVTTATSLAVFGNVGSVDATLDTRMSDIYIDNSNALTDPGNIFVAAKRPNANGTTNGFTTQIGSGGSGYGTGHSPQVNERPLSTTNGWSMVGAGSAVTEEYNVEGKTVGDANLSLATIVDFMGWVFASSLSSETASIIVNGTTSNISLTSTNTMFTKIAGSASYPAGTGTDIGIITTTALTTVSLFECGIVVAYIPYAMIEAEQPISQPTNHYIESRMIV